MDRYMLELIYVRHGKIEKLLKIDRYAKNK